MTTTETVFAFEPGVTPSDITPYKVRDSLDGVRVERWCETFEGIFIVRVHMTYPSGYFKDGEAPGNAIDLIAS